MTVTDAERLVQRVVETLLQNPNDPQGQKYAQEYAAACRTVNLRLDQCETMLAAGDDHQALQLAETPPAVLDLVTVLAFQQAREWRAFCRSRGWPLAATLNGKAIRLLNEALEKGANVQHPLYREYRQAMARRDDLAALQVLRQIVAFDPGDRNAARELERVEKQALDTRLKALEAAVHQDDQDEVLARLDQIEGAGFTLPPQGTVWQRAQLVRCQRLVARAVEFRRTESWREAEPLVEWVNRLVAQHGLQLPGFLAERFAPLKSWVAAERDGARTAEAGETALRDLQRLLDAVEARQIERRVGSLAELRNDAQALRRKQLEIERLGYALPEELDRRCQQATRSLDALVRRLARRRRALAVTASLTVAALLVSLAAWMIGETRKRDLAGQLKRLREHRQVVAVERLMADADQEAAKATPLLRSELAQDAAFLALERERQKGFLQRLERVQAELGQSGPDASADELKAKVDALNADADGLAADLQPEARTALRKLEEQWHAALEQWGRTRAEEVRQQLADAERDGAGLAFEQGPPEVRRVLALLTPRMDRLRLGATSRIETLRWPADLALRFEALQRKTLRHQIGLAQFDAAQAVFTRPERLDDYLATLRVVETNEFWTETDQRAARAVLALQPGETNLLHNLLQLGPPELPTPMPPAGEVAAWPADSMPAERTKLAQLRDDELIQNTVIYRRSAAGGGSGDPGRGQILYARGRSLTRTRTGQPQLMVFRPASRKFEPETFYGPQVALEEVGLTPETSAYEAAGLRNIFDPNTGRFCGGLLTALDSLNAAGEASPLFRAYVALRLYELAELRPLEWGYAWSPSAVAERRQLRALRAEGIRSGDWLVQERAGNLDAALANHFLSAQRVSLARQSAFFQRLLGRAWAARLVFAGFAGADGQPRFAPDRPGQRELWGWTSVGRGPALLWRAGGSAWVQPPMPFSPLFALGADRGQLLNQTLTDSGLSKQDPAVEPFLPLLFQTLP